MEENVFYEDDHLEQVFEDSAITRDLMKFQFTLPPLIL